MWFVQWFCNNNLLYVCMSCSQTASYGVITESVIPSNSVFPITFKLPVTRKGLLGYLTKCLVWGSEHNRIQWWKETATDNLSSFLWAARVLYVEYYRGRLWGKWITFYYWTLRFIWRSQWSELLCFYYSTNKGDEFDIVTAELLVYYIVL